MNDKIANDLKDALKSQDKFKMGVLRMLKSALQNEQINKKHDLSDDEIISVINKQVKLRKDSSVEYEKYGKSEEVDNLTKEIEILNNYLPEEASEEEISKMLDEAFLEIKPESMRDMGKIMAYASSHLANADAKLVSDMVKERLNK